MTIKSDEWIREQVWKYDMIRPFETSQVRIADTEQGHGVRVISYGTSSYGYDVRCASEFKVFTAAAETNPITVIDPKNFNEHNFAEVNQAICIIPPNSFVLARTIERFKIPRNILTICVGKMPSG